MSLFPRENQVDVVRNKVLEMEYELSSIRTLLTKYENTKCPDKGDAIICDVIDKFEDLEAHSSQAQNWASVI
jgi:hypothetical protein